MGHGIAKSFVLVAETLVILFTYKKSWGHTRSHNLYKKVHFEKDYFKNSFIFYAIRKVNL